MITQFTSTLLPEPVWPATSRCGMLARSVQWILPLMSLPSANVRMDFDWRKLGESMTSLRAITSRFRLGTSTPTVGLPGMRSTRIDSHSRARQRSSERLTILLYRTPRSGLYSKVVTTGPGLIWLMLPRTPNSSSFSTICRPVSCNCASSYEARSKGGLSSLVPGTSYRGLEAAGRLRGGVSAALGGPASMPSSVLAELKVADSLTAPSYGTIGGATSASSLSSGGTASAGSAFGAGGSRTGLTRSGSGIDTEEPSRPGPLPWPMPVAPVSPLSSGTGAASPGFGSSCPRKRALSRREVSR